MNDVFLGTPDICDEHREVLQVADPVFTNYGGVPALSADIVTLKIDQDNKGFWDLLRQPGNDRLICVDAGGFYGAVMGDMMATLAIEHGWRGMLINGYIRDTAVIKTMPLAVWALGSCPMKGIKKADYTLHQNLAFAGLEISEAHRLYGDEDGIVISEQYLEKYESSFQKRSVL